MPRLMQPRGCRPDDPLEKRLVHAMENWMDRAKDIADHRQIPLLMCSEAVMKELVKEYRKIHGPRVYLKGEHIPPKGTGVGEITEET